LAKWGHVIELTYFGEHAPRAGLKGRGARGNFY